LFRGFALEAESNKRGIFVNYGQEQAIVEFLLMPPRVLVKPSGNVIPNDIVIASK
jgi:hypothetical protein